MEVDELRDPTNARAPSGHSEVINMKDLLFRSNGHGYS